MRGQEVPLQGLPAHRTIRHGKSASFNYTGRMTGRYHERGKPFSARTTRRFRADNLCRRLLISDVAIYDLDELMLHFDVRQEYSKKVGESLALASTTAAPACRFSRPVTEP